MDAAALHARLEATLASLGLDARALAARLVAPAWVVGGIVRDALLDRPTRDVDLVVDGDAVAAARRLASAAGGELTVHPAFGTAAVRLGAGTVDLVTARTETYPAPGSLPVVRPADLDADLRRRDFAANALAVALTSDGYGALVDLLGGVDDVRARRLRVLHARSFEDDPTRILRGARYGARLGFAWEPGTEELARAAVEADLLAAVGVDRLRHELLLLLDEPDAVTGLERLDALGALPALVPGVRLGGAVREALGRVGGLADRHEPDARRAAVRLGLLLGPLPPAARDAAVSALGLSRADDRVARAAATAAELAPRLAARVGGDRVDEVLGRLPPEAALAVAAVGEESSSASATDWLDRLRHVRLELDGDDLQVELGLRPSAALGTVLAELRRGKLRGELPDRAAELRLARRLAAEVRDART